MAGVDAKPILLLFVAKDLRLRFCVGFAMGTRLGMRTGWLALALMPPALRLVLAPRVTVGRGCLPEESSRWYLPLAPRSW